MRLFTGKSYPELTLEGVLIKHKLRIRSLWGDGGEKYVRQQFFTQRQNVAQSRIQ